MKRPEAAYLDENQHAIKTQSEIDNRSPEECLGWSDDDWKNAHRELKNLPYLTANHELYSKIEDAFYDISQVRGLSSVSEYDSKASAEMIDPRLIVRAPSFQNWSSYYHPYHTKESEERNESCVVEIARKIARRTTSLPEDGTNDEGILKSLHDIFHKEDTNIVGVKLNRINGPRGPIYLVSDGSHRIAAAKLVGLKEIWASVGEIEPEKGINLWFDACREMPEEARRELMRIYDLVYPPTEEDLANEEKLSAEARKREREYSEMKQQYYIERERKSVASALKFAERKRVFERAQRIYEKLKGDPVFEQIRSKEALEHIREYMQENKNQAIRFYEEYRCEMTSTGRLLNKDGSESYIHTTGYDVGPFSYSVVLARAVKTYEQRYPDKIAEIDN